MTSFRYIIIVLNWLLDHVNLANIANVYHFKVIIWIIDPLQGFLKAAFEKYMALEQTFFLDYILSIVWVHIISSEPGNSNSMLYIIVQYNMCIIM